MNAYKNIFRVAGIGLVLFFLILPSSAQSLKERYLNPMFPSSTLDSGFTSWQWLNPLPQGNGLNDAQMFDENTIIAVGDAGTIVRTTNSGKTWSVQHRINGFSGSIKALSFPDTSVGIAVGTHGMILRTTDRGSSWVSIESHTHAALYDVCFTDRNIGTAVGHLGTILRSTNGGNTWTRQDWGNTNDYLYGVSFISEDTGYVVGEWARILRTTNGGKVWEEQSYGSHDYLVKVSFVNGQKGVAVGDWFIHSTTDAGEHWSIVDYWSLANTFYDVNFRNDSLGFVAADGMIQRTTNFGATWTVVQSEGRFLSFLDDNIGVKVGSGGVILKTMTSGLTWEKLTSGSDIELTEVEAVDSTAIIAIGEQGTILRTTNGGIDWVIIQSNSAKYLMDISFVSPAFGIIVGDSNTVLRSSDGGITWLDLPSIHQLRKVCLTGIDSGWALGERGAYSTTDGGITWNLSLEQGFFDEFYSLNFSSIHHGIVAGFNHRDFGAVYYRTTNFGITWDTIKTDSEIRINDLVCNDTKEWIGVGSAFWGMVSHIVRSTDDGKTWHVTRPDQMEALRSVEAINSETIVTVGDGGLILLSTDSGSHWREWKSPANTNLSSISFSRSNGSQIGIAVGQSGSILVSALSPLNPKTWTWTGLYDSSWNNPNNWSPVGTPLPGDSVIIAPAIHSPIIDSVQQQIVIASLNILSGGRLTITDALPRFVVLADVTVYGTLEIRPPATTTIIVGGNWTIQPGGSEERFAHLSKTNSFKLSDEGFIPYHSTVLFSGSGAMAGNFYNVMFDTTSSMRSIGNISFQNQCTMVGDVNLRTNDTVFVQASFPQALVGPGKLKRGTIKRVIQSGELESYSFESEKTFVQFHGSGIYPSTISMTTYPETSPTIVAHNWTVIPSRVDTLNNIITADTVTEFSKWVFGIPRPTGMEKDLDFEVVDDTIPIVGRLYNIHSEGGSGFSARLSLRYEQSEVPPGMSEDSLQLIREIHLSLE